MAKDIVFRFIIEYSSLRDFVYMWCAVGIQQVSPKKMIKKNPTCKAKDIVFRFIIEY
jgi:hypothetical protein